jgi:hypothetical protein
VKIIICVAKIWKLTKKMAEIFGDLVLVSVYL